MLLFESPSALTSMQVEDQCQVIRLDRGLLLASRRHLCTPVSRRTIYSQKRLQTVARKRYKKKSDNNSDSWKNQHVVVSLTAAARVPCSLAWKPRFPPAPLWMLPRKSFIASWSFLSSEDGIILRRILLILNANIRRVFHTQQPSRRVEDLLMFLNPCTSGLAACAFGG